MKYRNKKLPGCFPKLIATVIGLLLITVQPAPAQATPELSAQDRSELSALIETAPFNQPVPFDFSQSEQVRVYKKQLELAGVTPEGSPHFFEVLDETIAAHRGNHGPTGHQMTFAEAYAEDAIVPINVITSLGSEDGQVFTASGLSSVQAGGLINITLGLLDGDGNPIGDFEEVQEFDKNIVTIQAEGLLPSPGESLVEALGTYYYEPIDPSDGPQFGFFTATTAGGPQEINNEAPKNNTYDNKIKICLDRTDRDCDWGTLSDDQYNLLLPIKGQVDYLDPVDPPTPENTLSSATLVLLTGGGCPITGEFLDYVTSPDEYSLAWDLDPASFGHACFQQKYPFVYNFTFSAETQGLPIFTSITNAGEVKPNPSSEILPPMEFVWGCLAEGTKVTMADGEQVPIEDLTVQEDVLSNDNQPAKIVDTTIGFEGDTPLIFLVTDKGHKVLLTQEHPIFLEGGEVTQAKDLTLGTIVRTQENSATIVGLAYQTTEDRVWNLRVAKENEEEDAIFFANGIMVGDIDVQRKYALLSRQTVQSNSPSAVLEGLPEVWHQDYLNYLEAHR